MKAPRKDISFWDYQIMFDNTENKVPWCEKHDQPIRKDHPIELESGRKVRARAGHCYKCLRNIINGGTCDPI